MQNEREGGELRPSGLIWINTAYWFPFRVFLFLLYDSYEDQIQDLTHARQMLCKWTVSLVLPFVPDVVDINVKQCQ